MTGDPMVLMYFFSSKKLQDKNIQERFTSTVNEQLRATKRVNTDTSTTSQNHIDVISKTAVEILPDKQKQVNTNSDFKDDELLDSRSGELKGSDTYKSQTKKIKKHVRYLRNNRLLREAEQINSHATRQETEELFRLMKNNDSSFRPIKKTNKCEPEKLKEHFSKHLNVAPPNNIPDELLEIPQYIKNLQDAQSADLNHAPPTTEEIKKTPITLKKW